MESPTADTGAPVVDTEAALAGNGRLEGLILGYEDANTSSQRYRGAIIQKAAALGLGDVSGIPDPILIREVVRHTAGTRENFVDESNPKDKGLAETPAEGALRDAKALGDLSGLTWNEDGNLSADSAQEVHRRLIAAQRGITTNLAGKPVGSEATKRVQLAALANLAKAGNVDVADFIGLLESNHGRRAVTDVVRTAPALQTLDPDLALATDALGALRELQTGLHARETKAHDSLNAWHSARKTELLTSDLSEAQERILEMMVLGQKKPGLLRSFFDAYLSHAKHEQAERDADRATPSLLGDSRQAATAADLIGRAAARIHEELAAGQGHPDSLGQAQIAAAAQKRLDRIRASGLFTNDDAARHLAERSVLPSTRKRQEAAAIMRQIEEEVLARMAAEKPPEIKDRPTWGPAAHPEAVAADRKYWLRKDGAAVQVTDHLAGAHRAQADSDDWENRSKWGYQQMFDRGWLRIHTEDFQGPTLWINGLAANMTRAQRAWLRDARDAWARKTGAAVDITTGRGQSPLQVDLGASRKRADLPPDKAAKAYEKLFDLEQEGKKLTTDQRAIFERAEDALGQHLLFGRDEFKSTAPAEDLRLESETDNTSWAPQQLSLFATQKRREESLPDYIKPLAKTSQNAIFNREHEAQNQPAQDALRDAGGSDRGDGAPDRGREEATGGRAQRAPRPALPDEYHGLREYDGQALVAGLAKLDPALTGKEHLAYRAGNLAIKLTKPGATGARRGVADYIGQQSYINERLGDDSLAIGYVYLPGEDKPRLLTTQTWFDGRESTPDEIDSFMRHKGFLKAFEGAWFDPRDESKITDADPRNFITVTHPDRTISVHPIDVIVTWPTRSFLEMVENQVNAAKQPEPLHQLVDDGHMRLPSEADTPTAAGEAPPAAAPNKGFWRRLFLGSARKAGDTSDALPDSRFTHLLEQRDRLWEQRRRIIGDIRPASFTDAEAWDEYQNTISRIPELWPIDEQLTENEQRLRILGHEGFSPLWILHATRKTAGDFDEIRGAALRPDPFTDALRLDNAILTGPSLMAGIKAWHGTPHEVDRFRTDKIGTGEGVQAYGHGLYFAEIKQTAASYINARGDAGHLLIDGKPPSEYPSRRNGKFDRRPEQTEEELLAEWARSYPKFSDLLIATKGRFQRIHDLALKFQSAGRITERGNLYTVEIDAKPDDFIDYGKPMFEQSAKVQQFAHSVAKSHTVSVRKDGDAYTIHPPLAASKTLFFDRNAAQKAADRINAGRMDRVPDSGASLYARAVDVFGSAKQASAAAAAAGIKGIRYLDQRSRNRPLNDIKREFLDRLPEDAQHEDTLDEIERGAFTPEQSRFLRALAADDWLGFDYPAQAISAALSPQLANYEASAELKASIDPLLKDATYNYVVFDDKHIKIIARNGERVDIGPLFGEQTLAASRKRAEEHPSLFDFATAARDTGRTERIADLVPDIPDSKLDLWAWASDATPSHDVPRSTPLESDRTRGGSRDTRRKGRLQTQRQPARPPGRPLDESGEGSRDTADRGPLSADVPALAHGEPGNSEFRGQTPEPQRGPAGSERPGGSSEHHDQGAEPDSPGAGDSHPDLVPPAPSTSPLAPGRPGSHDVSPGSAGLPAGQSPERKSPLTPEQHGDVAFIERRLLDNGKPGVLITNGTGTGKTFSGLGAIANALDRGAKHILVVAPSDKVCSDWKDTANQFFGINDAYQLEGINDNGGGHRLVITTYANLGQNPTLVHRPWDIVVSDEAHYLSQAQDGGATNALAAFRALTWHPDGLSARAEMHHPAEVARRDELRAIDYRVRTAAQESELRALHNQIDATRSTLASEQAAMGDAGRPKALLVSATPFAYHFSLDYAEGYLFDHGPEPTSTAYNTPSARDRFYIENFGYRMRTGKLTQPENAAATAILERQFAERLMREGAMSGRSLEVPFDYSRKFILTESAIGNRVDQIIELLRSTPRFNILSKYIGLGDYLARRYLLEGLKAKEAIARVQQHLALGRKVVVFHDYKKGGARNPLAVTFPPDRTETFLNPDTNRYESVNLADLHEEFKRAVGDYDQVRDALGGLGAPIDVFRRAFPDAGIFNGSVPKKQRRKIVADFNKTGGKMNVLLVQRASGKEGISLHDRDGKHQRAFIDLGIPGRPTDAIQGEGRIYRHGLASHAVIEYLSTGTNFERWTFAQTIAQRASTAENLAMGERARALLQSFASAYNDAEYEAPHIGQGTGGKEADRARDHGDPFDNAVALFFTNQKKTSRNKSAEGQDYFATPEPIGFKMVEWAQLKPGEKALEPSAGHGAIARFLPDATTRHAVEPSGELAGRLALNAPDTEIHQIPFEDYSTVNKFDAVAMNPPFGTAGKMAMEHLIKATAHLRDGGRVVALIPMGSSMEKRFDAWRESPEAEDMHMRAEILLPSATFSRAGTSVVTRIVILDKAPAKRYLPFTDTAHADLTSAQDHKELFDRLRHIGVPDRPREIPPPAYETTEDQDAETIRRGIDAVSPYRAKIVSPYRSQDEPHVRRWHIGSGWSSQTEALQERLGPNFKVHNDFGSATVERIHNPQGEGVPSPRPPQPSPDRAAIDALLSGRGGKIPLPGETAPSPISHLPSPAAPPALPTPARESLWSPVDFPHTQTGQTQFAVKINRRLSNDQFAQAKAAAKALGGYYSRYKGRGAVPGFIFRSPEARDQFIGSHDIITPLASARKSSDSSVTQVDTRAHAAATSPHNDLPHPSKEQKDAGNYQMGHLRLAGMDITIENPQGSVRSGVTREGKPWRTELKDHYGYIRRTEGKDGDHLDLFLKPGTPSDYAGPVHVINQHEPTTGKFDEHKAVIGAASPEEAREIYHRNYQPGWQGYRSMVTMPIEKFKAWATERKRIAPAKPGSAGIPAGSPPHRSVDARTTLDLNNLHEPDILPRDQQPPPLSAEQQQRALSALGRSLARQTGDPSQAAAYRPASQGKQVGARSRLEFTQALASLFGRRIVVYESDNPSMRGVVNAGARDLVFLNVDNPRPHWMTLGHELWHHIDTYHPDLARQTRESLDPLIINRDRLAAEKNAEGYHAAEHMDELYADFLGDNMARPEFWQMLAEKKPGIFMRASVIIQRWLKSVLDALRGRGYGTSQYFRDIEAAQGILSDTVAEFAAREQGLAPHDRPIVPQEGSIIGARNQFSSPSPVGRGRAQPLTEHVRLDAAHAVPIADLQPDQDQHVFIQSPAGGLQEVRALYQQGIKPVYRVQLRGGQSARFTKDHIFVVKLDDRASAPLNMRLADIIAAREQGRNVYLPVMP